MTPVHWADADGVVHTVRWFPQTMRPPRGRCGAAMPPEWKETREELSCLLCIGGYELPEPKLRTNMPNMQQIPRETKKTKKTTT